MKRLHKSVIFGLALVAIAIPIHADAPGSILATNAWTAAFATAAGADEVALLAPAEMTHPPEYELLPSDVRKIRDANLLVYAGYEALMKTVFDSFGKPGEELARIRTGYAPEVLRSSILILADRFGTRPEALENLEEIDTFFAVTRERLARRGLAGAPILVHFHQRPFAEALGFEILGVYGPGPLDAGLVRDLGATEPAFIIDNAHNPIAAPLEEILGVPAVELSNFPGVGPSGEPESLLDVMTANRERLLDVP